MRTLAKTLALALSASLAMPLWAQTCPAGIAETKPASQYQINSDGTVTDKKTDLVWAQCTYGLSGNNCATGSAQSFTWKGALDVAQAANSAEYLGHGDWRLPNIKELQSLAEKACYSPAINEVVFPNTLSSGYWSSSPLASNSNDAWLVSFGDGYEGHSYKSFSLYVRLVRAGQ